MAREVKLQAIRTTRAALDAQAAVSGLFPGEPYLITDEGKIAMGTGVDGYTTAAQPGSAQTWTAAQSFSQISGATNTIASADAWNKTLTLDGRVWDIMLDVTPTITLAAVGTGYSFALILFRENATGGFTPAFAGSPILHSEQTINTAAEKTFAYIAWTPDGGTTFFLDAAGAAE